MRKARLQVISPEGQIGAKIQDCGSCLNAKRCWTQRKNGKDAPVRQEHIMINLLVCRIKRGYEVNQSSKALLAMLRPVLKNMAKWAIRQTSIDLETALADLESETIECIMHRYIMGEIGYPMHFLTGFPKGSLRLFANNYGKKTRQYEEMHVLDRSKDQDFEELSTRSASQITSQEEEDEDDTRNTRIAREVVEDGITLTNFEYRVLSFCMQNCSDQKRPLDRLHKALERSTSINRAKITKACGDAKKKVLNEVLKC